MLAGRPYGSEVLHGHVHPPVMPVPLALLEEPLRQGGVEIGDLSDADVANLALRLTAAVEFSAFQWAQITSSYRWRRPL